MSHLSDSKASVRALLDSKGWTVHTISPDATVFEAISQMAEHGIGALVVLDEGKLIGIISERDYTRKVILKGRHSQQTAVRYSAEVTVLPPRRHRGGLHGVVTESQERYVLVIDRGMLWNCFERSQIKYRGGAEGDHPHPHSYIAGGTRARAAFVPARA